MTDNGPMLKVDDIHTYCGDSYVLQGLSLEIAEGQVMVVLGRNGMGKTMLIRSTSDSRNRARGKGRRRREARKNPRHGPDANPLSALSLEERLRNIGNQPSGGDQQMLIFARSLMTNPEMLLLDEPTEGTAHTGGE